MTAHAEIIPSVVDRIKQSLVGLKMPRAIEILDATVRRIERGGTNALEAIDAFSPRSSPCVRTGSWLSSDCGILRFN